MSGCTGYASEQNLCERKKKASTFKVTAKTKTKNSHDTCTVMTTQRFQGFKVLCNCQRAFFTLNKTLSQVVSPPDFPRDFKISVALHLCVIYS